MITCENRLIFVETNVAAGHLKGEKIHKMCIEQLKGGSCEDCAHNDTNKDNIKEPQKVRPTGASLQISNKTRKRVNLHTAQESYGERKPQEDRIK